MSFKQAATCGHALLAFVLLVGTPAPKVVRAAPQTPPSGLTPQEIRIYEDFRAWIGSQPKDMQDADDEVVYRSYTAALRAKGTSEPDAAAAIVTLKGIGDRAEIERWNRILTSAKPAFNTAPNAFLVSVTKGVKPGRALDVGMGQGRNTIYLAQQGWESVGFDPADRAVAAAQQQAARRRGIPPRCHEGSADRRRRRLRYERTAAALCAASRDSVRRCRRCG